jgi:hypothetical protein
LANEIAGVSRAAAAACFEIGERKPVACEFRIAQLEAV